jgi:hypothetical protein
MDFPNVPAKVAEINTSITGTDRRGRVETFHVGDKVRVFPDMGPSGVHPFAEADGGFDDTVRACMMATNTLGKRFPAVVLTRVSWCAISEIQPVR